MKRFLALFVVHCALFVAPAARAAENLTTFNNSGGAVNNNMYNQMMNPDRAAGTAAVAKSDFGNCNALIQRCATPKCGAGCTDINVARPIVAGCVMDSAECKKHGDPLIDAIAAQMVATSTTKTNNAASQAAQQQAAAAAQQSAQQMEQMNQQMAAMQQQMAAQQAESQAQMQQALAQQQAAQQAMMEQQQQQQAAAAAAAPTPEQTMASNGISAEMIAREQIVGQVMSSLDGVNSGLNELKTVVQNVSDYAGCDYSAISCTGPARIATFRNKAQGFFQPYDNILNSLDESLFTAVMAGIDVSDIYMMLTNSCNQWAKYLCNTKNANPVAYCRSKNGNSWTSTENSVPYGCSLSKTTAAPYRVDNPNCHVTQLYRPEQKDEVHQNWIAATEGDETRERMACVDDVTASLGGRRQRKKGGGGFDIDALEHIILQDGLGDNAANAKKYCAVDPGIVDAFRSIVTTKNYNSFYKVITYDQFEGLREAVAPSTRFPGEECDLDVDSCMANPAFAMCSTHVYNINGDGNEILSDASKKKQMTDVIALKSTIIVQQLKKQYDYINSMVKQIKIQLQKSILTAKAEAAGAPSGSSSSSSGGGALPSGQIDCRFKSAADTISCVRNNLPGLNQLASGTNTADYRSAAQMNADAIIGAGGVKAGELTKEDLQKCYAQGIPPQERKNCVSTISLGISIIEKTQAASQTGGLRIGFN